MTTTNPRTARVVTSGGSNKELKPASNGLTPGVVVGRRDIPSTMWNEVRKGEVGKGFMPMDFERPEKKAKVRAKNRRESNDEERAGKNKFVLGSSPMIWFWITPKVKQEKAKEKKKPINYQNKLDEKTRRHYTKVLEKNIDSTANFMVKDILPLTMSLHSGLERAKELVQQLLDVESLPLPEGYIQSKVSMAINLRIIRFVSDQYNLSDEERKLMALEYTRPWSQS
jgi:hypothetical protein